MGQVIRFPAVSDVYPTRSSGLDDAEAVLLIGLRWWTADIRHRQDPVPRLRHGLDLAGACDAADLVNALMSIAVRTAQHPLEIHGPQCDCLSRDETQMLQAASLVQQSDNALAERVMRTALLTAQGADMALGPLQGIGRIFSAARLLLRRRFAPPVTGAEHSATLH